jgi:hypothetical protein
MKGRLSQFAIAQGVVLQAEPFLCPADDERNLCQGSDFNGEDSDLFPQNYSFAGGINCRQASLSM